MSRIEWDKVGERFYETGVSNGVLYPAGNTGGYPRGYAWNGLTGVTASPSGAESTKQYADNIAYLNLTSAEEFGGTIEAFTSPVEFDQCDGTASPVPGINVGQQSRKSFGFSWQTLVGNDTEGQDHAYKIHVAYGAMAAPSEKAYATVNDSPEAITLSWTFTTTPAPIVPELIVAGRALKPTATLSFDSRNFSASKMQELKDVLYGTPSTEARLPAPRELINLMQAGALVEAVPSNPTFSTVDDTITIPVVTGVEYRINNNKVDGIVEITEPTLVTAVPTSGYKFPAVTQTQWVYDPEA